MPRRSTVDPLAAAIGARLRAFREARGWKLEEVAFHGGLASKGHLSDIEHGRVVPTVRTLATLARHFELELFDLVAFPERGGRHALIEAARGLDAGIVERWLAEARDAARDAAAARGEEARAATPRLRIVRGAKPAGAFVPLVDLDAAGSVVGPPWSVSAAAWVAVDAAAARLPDAFVARVRGSSMEPRVPAGAHCLFRRPGPGNRAGRLFLVQLRKAAAPDDGGAYALKLVDTLARKGRRTVTLRSLHRGSPPVVLDARRSDVQIVAEFVAVLPA